MNKNLSPQQMKLYKRIDEVLYYKWDPIGISDVNWERDEYQSYLPQIFKLTLENNNPESIANYLTIIATDNMGLSEAKEHDIKTAKLLLEIKKALACNGKIKHIYQGAQAGWPLACRYK